MKIIENGNICSPAGFQAAGVIAGLKTNGKEDVALIVSDCDAVAAGAFTSSKVKAAPVILSEKHLLSSKSFRAVFVNSGNANACTGQTGMDNARETVELVASALKIKPEQVLISSTGRIGTYLPMEKIRYGVKTAVSALSYHGGKDTSRAIMTTDTRPKEIALSFEIGSKSICIAGIVKGAGMIAPEMKVPHATMLGYITTDAAISSEALSLSLETAVENSFNRISVDGDMSTNDTVIALANGKAENPVIHPGSPEAELFGRALTQVMQKLAKDIVLDGEGITKFVTVDVQNAATIADAKLAAKAISESLLCKTAWFGGDPNWGRILAAAGYSGAQFDQTKLELFYDDKPVVINGEDAGTPEKELDELMKKDSFTITLKLNCGTSSYEMWTNDISYEYVKINADYHT